MFRELAYGSDVNAIVLTGAGGNFSSGGDVHEIIGPLTRMSTPDLLEFTRMTGDIVKAMRNCPQPIIAAIDGVCAGAGAMIALASDLRLATPEAKPAFLFTRVGLAGPTWARAASAADHRPGTRRRSALYRPHDDALKGRALGLLQCAPSSADALRRKRPRWPATSPTARILRMG